MDIAAEQRDAISLILSHKKANGERGFFYLCYLPKKHTNLQRKINSFYRNGFC